MFKKFPKNFRKIFCCTKHGQIWQVMITNPYLRSRSIWHADCRTVWTWILDRKLDKCKYSVGVKSGDRFAFMATPGIEYLACLWAAWSVNAIAVPLSLKSPIPELQYVLGDARPKGLRLKFSIFSSLISKFSNLVKSAFRIRFV